MLSLTSMGLYIGCLSQMGPTSFDGLTVVATCIYSCCAALSCSFLRPLYKSILACPDAREALQSTDLCLTMNKLNSPPGC